MNSFFMALQVSALVQSALDGYNVCLFSYGQTGSGKTFTMQGTPEGEMRGMIPRSIDKVHHLSSLSINGQLNVVRFSKLLVVSNNKGGSIF